MDLSYHNIWKITYPIFISLFLQQIVGITDVIFLGHLGEVALSASALGTTYFLTIFMIAVGFANGAQIIMARRNGEHNFDKIGEVFYQALEILFFASLFIIGISYFFTPLLLIKIISSPQVFEATIKYIDWRFWGYIPLFIIIMIRAYFIAVTNTKIIGIASVVTVLCNVFLNYCLIFGHFSFPRLDIAGAALASVISEFIGLIIFLAYALFKINLKKYGLNKLSFSNWNILKEIFNLSTWTMLQQFISISSWFIFFLAIEHLGTNFLAISNILRSLSAFPYVIILAMGITAGTLTSNLIGANEADKVIYCCNKLMKISALLTSVILIIFLIFPRQIIALYTPEEALVYQAQTAFFVMIGANIPLMFGYILFNAISGTGHTFKALIFEFFATFAYLIHIYYVIIYLKADIAWCWTADYVYNIILLSFSAYYIYGKKWCCIKI